MRLSPTVCSLALLLSLSPPALANSSRIVLHDTEVIADRELSRGTEASIQVTVLGAASLTERAPIAGARVTVELRGSAKRAARAAKRAKRPVRRMMARGATPANGTFIARFVVPPELPTGNYELVIRTQSRHGKSIVRQAVEIHCIHGSARANRSRHVSAGPEDQLEGQRGQSAQRSSSERASCQGRDSGQPGQAGLARSIDHRR